MTTIHLIRASNFNTSHFSSALRVASKNDAIVLLDDGCYNINHSLITSELVQAFVTNNRVYVINAHCKARALNNTEQYNLIEMPALVDLSLQYDKVITWQ